MRPTLIDYKYISYLLTNGKESLIFSRNTSMMVRFGLWCSTPH